jgi:hypothetical protein
VVNESAASGSSSAWLGVEKEKKKKRESFEVVENCDVLRDNGWRWKGGESNDQPGCWLASLRSVQSARDRLDRATRWREEPIGF